MKTDDGNESSNDYGVYGLLVIPRSGEGSILFWISRQILVALKPEEFLSWSLSI